MDTFDSRTLGYTDCYARAFPSAGRIQYSLSFGGPHPDPADATLVILVGDKPRGQPTQHDVTVRCKEGRLVADPARIEIASGDVVLWHAIDSTTPRFTVRGVDPESAWSNSALSGWSLFSHVFGLPGEFHWVDAIGGKLSGSVVVASPRAAKDPSDHRDWMNTLKSGAFVSIDGHSVTPQTVEIVVGQVVLFAVSNVPAPGLTITDRRLLPATVLSNVGIGGRSI